MRRVITHAVVHTAAAARNGRPRDVSVDEIRAWHLARGFDDVGYHWVVRADGRVEAGRPEERAGAGVLGFNARSVHVCLSGHGDLAPPTPEQLAAAAGLIARIAERHGFADEVLLNPMRVLGHREVWTARLVPAPIRKTCPGRLVDMRAFRLAVLRELAR